MDAFCDGKTARAQPITVDVVPEKQKQYQADALRLLAGLAAGGLECRKLQIRCGGTPCLHSDIMAIEEGEVTGFRSAPDFDLVFFTFATGQLPGADMLKLLQYCRMLLKPGGTLALLLPVDKAQPWYHLSSVFIPLIQIMARKSFPVTLLRRAGLVNIQQKQVRKFGVIIIGNRPLPYWRS